MWIRTSFDDRALLVKSLQHDVKHFSTRFEYIFKKSCIYCRQEQHAKPEPNRRTMGLARSTCESSVDSDANNTAKGAMS